MASKAEHILKLLTMNRQELLRRRAQQQNEGPPAPAYEAENPLLRELAEWNEMTDRALKRI